MDMICEFNPEKSATDRDKHGIDFDEAQLLWDDPWLLEAPARTVDEPRTIVVGKIGNRHWAAVFTYRGERIRIISVRRAREEEIERYESA